MKTCHFTLIKHLHKKNKILKFRTKKKKKLKHFCLFLLSQFKELRIISGAYKVILDNGEKKGKVVVTDALLQEEEK